MWYCIIIDDRPRSGQYECSQSRTPARIYTPPHRYPYTLHNRTYCAPGYHCPHIRRPAKSRDFLLSGSVMILEDIGKFGSAERLCWLVPFLSQSSLQNTIVRILLAPNCTNSSRLTVHAYQLSFPPFAGDFCRKPLPP